MYQVTGDRLIKITNKLTGAFSVIGTIEGSEQIKWDVGFNHAVIVVQGGKTYTLSKADALVDVSANTNFVPFVDVTHIDGRFMYVPADGSPARFSDVGIAGTIDVLSFFDAEELPDGTNGIFNLGNTVLVAGPHSIEQFRNTGGFPIPFSRIPSGRFLYGYIGGFIEYEESVCFVGRQRGQDYGIFRASQGRVEKISTEPIDRILKKHTLAELAGVVTGRFNWIGYPILSFSLKRNSFAYFKGQWFELDTVTDGFSRPWGGGYITQFEGEYFTAYSDKIGKLSTANNDYGSPITRTIDLGFNQENNERFSCGSIELGISQGFNEAVGSVALMTSHDNVLYNPPFFRDLGAKGKYRSKLVWQYKGGLGSYDGFMGIRFQTTQGVKFSTDYLIANFT
jgi:hypothetical protein